MDETTRGNERFIFSPRIQTHLKRLVVSQSLLS